MTVAQMREALDTYLEPAEVATSPDVKQSTIEFVAADAAQERFPALSDSVSTINKITA